MRMFRVGLYLQTFMENEMAVLCGMVHIVCLCVLACNRPPLEVGAS